MCNSVKVKGSAVILIIHTDYGSQFGFCLPEVVTVSWRMLILLKATDLQTTRMIRTQTTKCNI